MNKIILISFIFLFSCGVGRFRPEAGLCLKGDGNKFSKHSYFKIISEDYTQDYKRIIIENMETKEILKILPTENLENVNCNEYENY